MLASGVIGYVGQSPYSEQPRIFTPRELDNSNSTLLVCATSSVLLQTLDCYHGMKIKILMDSGSQQTDVLEKVIDFLGLKPIDKHLVSIKTFGKSKGKRKGM